MPALARVSSASIQAPTLTPQLALGIAARETLGRWWPERERLAPNFRLNRRCTERWLLWGGATLLGLGVDLGQLIELEELDCAPWWIAGDSRRPVRVGTRVSIGFSHPHCRPARAVVMRCQRSSIERYRVALRFDGIALV